MQTGSLKPWQIGLFILAFGAIAFGLYTVMAGPKVKIATELTYVDIQTGDLFYFKIKKSAVVPAMNPDTGNASLLPCVKTDTGYRISRHYLGAIEIIAVPPDAVNTSTGDVKVSAKPMRTLEHPAGGKFRTDDPTTANDSQEPSGTPSGN